MLMSADGLFSTSAGPGKAARGPMTESSSRARIMVVDDDRIVLAITRARLEGAGYEVITRDEGIGTIRAICEEQPDLVLLDISMPAISGESIAELAQKANGARDTAIVFHSGGGLVSLQRKAREAGVLGAIPKTESDGLFIAPVDRLLKLSQRRRRIR